MRKIETARRFQNELCHFWKAQQLLGSWANCDDTKRADIRLPLRPIIKAWYYDDNDSCEPDI